jgi:hypothetical protein
LGCLRFFFAALWFLLSGGASQAQYYVAGDATLSALLNGQAVPANVWDASIKISVAGEPPCSGTVINNHGDILTSMHCVLWCLENSPAVALAKLNPPNWPSEAALHDVFPDAFPISCRGQFRRRGGLLYTDTDQVEIQILATGPGYMPWTDSPTTDKEALVNLALQAPTAYKTAILNGYLGPSARLDYALLHVDDLEPSKSAMTTACLKTSFVPPLTGTATRTVAWPKRTLHQRPEQRPNSDGYHQVISLGEVLDLKHSHSLLVQTALTHPTDLKVIEGSDEKYPAYALYVSGLFLDPQVLLTTDAANWGSSGAGVLNANFEEIAIEHGPNDDRINPEDANVDFMATQLSEVRKDLATRLHWSEDKVRAEFDCQTEKGK